MDNIACILKRFIWSVLIIMKTKDLSAQIKEIKDWVKVNITEPIINKETGFPIEVSQKGIEHTLNRDLFKDKSGRFLDLRDVIKKFKIILRDAKLVESRKDKYELEDNLTIHEFEFVMEYKGKIEVLQIIVKEFVHGKSIIIKKRLFYNHRFMI